jgi:hypothetical protein
VTARHELPGIVDVGGQVDVVRRAILDLREKVPDEPNEIVTVARASRSNP